MLWGCVVAGLGLAAVSLLVPLPQGEADKAAVSAPAEPAKADTSAEVKSGAATAETPDAAKPAPEPAATPETTTTAAPAPAEPAAKPAETAPATNTTAEPAAKPAETADTTAEPGAKPAETAPATDVTAKPAPAAPAPQPEPAKPAAVADAPDAPSAPDAASSAPAVKNAAETAPAPGAAPAALPATAGADAAPAPAELPPAKPAEPTETLLTPTPDTPAPAAPALIEPDPAPATQPAAEPAPAPEKTLPAVIETDTAQTLAPSASLPTTAAGVEENKLPQIGDAPAATDQAAPAPVVDDRPITAYARAFTPIDGKPAFAVVLRDTGAVDLDRASLAALPFPITFAVDPADPGAAAAAAIYRAAGQEVVMLASGIPAGATAADLEQSFQANAAVLPETVAVLDLAATGFQDDRPLASLVVPVIGAGGRGVLTYDRGLNAADQVARREGVPSAVIFRDLDAEGEDAQKIRRYLDRAAFKAAQEGRVVVAGSTRPETIAALMEWTVEGRASSVELAPLTAVLAVP